MSLPALNGLNFFMADVRDGLGPFLGVYLQERGWGPQDIGLVMTVGGLAGMMATTPLGAVVDATKAKRAVMIIASIAIIVTSLTMLYVPNLAVTIGAQVVQGVAGAVIGPAIAAITLGLVKQAGFARQLGQNEAFNHGGTMFAALAGGGLGYVFGLQAVFWFMAAMAVFAIASALLIPAEAIDHEAARGGEAGSAASGGRSRSALLLTSAPLLVLASVLMLFHLGNGAMLPLLGQAMVARGNGDPSAATALTVVVAQLTMIPMALLAAKLAQTRGYWIVFVLALLALPLRGLIAASLPGFWVLVPVQILDGVGAGLLGVAVPGLVAQILRGSGHFNLGLGAVMTVQGIGASLSPTLGGWVAQSYGYGAAFMVLGGVALVALMLWLVATMLFDGAWAGRERGKDVVPIGAA
ncbi:MFS transporter [Bosea psychrotolerans]|uniref:Putative MFS family arabinose efflux permease n=1 Tax=Bosea psychrotolerans TaxID=1871628 RepID=A0A2S4M5H0_9HYPH|nr:MFS transporter [Bosea psychrotolerans]POR49958.1 putative MFS family arabinose efflux permease [Bosea psychrotolerans]